MHNTMFSFPIWYSGQESAGGDLEAILRRSRGDLEAISRRSRTGGSSAAGSPDQRTRRRSERHRPSALQLAQPLVAHADRAQEHPLLVPSKLDGHALGVECGEDNHVTRERRSTRGASGARCGVSGEARSRGEVRRALVAKSGGRGEVRWARRGVGRSGAPGCARGRRT